MQHGFADINLAPLRPIGGIKLGFVILNQALSQTVTLILKLNFAGTAMRSDIDGGPTAGFNNEINLLN